MHKSVTVSFSVLLLFLFMYVGCAPKAYKDALSSAVRFENQRDYEKAYEYYTQALKTKPDDAHIRSKINELGEIIAEVATEEAVKAFKSKKHKTALELLEKALSFDSDNKRANDCKLEVKREFEIITEKYSLVESFASKNMWIAAVNTLKEISESYHDDPDLETRIVEFQNDGYRYFMEAGFSARKEGAYSQSLSHFESADLLKTDDNSRQEIAIARKYVAADASYEHAKEMAEKNNILGAMEELIQAKEIVDDHVKINQLIAELIPEWSPMIFENGKTLMETEQAEEAYEAFFKLNRINPEYPELSKYLEETRSVFLGKNYKRLIDAQKVGDYRLIMELSQRILKEDPNFLDTREIMARTPISAFNMFYQQGLYYMKTGNCGKAIMCFRSAEQQLSKTQLTRDRIRDAWAQIRKGSSLKAIFLDFSQEIGDPSASRYITWKIKEQLKSELKGQGFKNLFVTLEEVEENEFITRSGMMTDINWGAVLSRGYNAVITGKISLLKQDTSVNSEWKTRKRTVRKIIDNEEYTRLLIRQAELRSGMNSKQWRKERRMSKSQIEDQLELIQEKLLTIPPKIETDVEEEDPYQLVKHTMTAHTQIDAEILAPDGSHIWPMKRYQDTYQIEDSVVPPNLASDDPKERSGDPLTLPSESEFKEQAIDHIVEQKIIPDLIENFQSYGMRFYDKANNLGKAREESGHDTVAFLDSIEEYYKFLACYEDKGEGVSLREKVKNKLDSHISDSWLIRRKK